jgi:two-component system, response regulator PdtaR
MNILIIEDNAIQAMSVEMMVKKMGYQSVQKALNVNQASKMVESFKPDILLVDIHLDSDVTGVDIVKQAQLKSDVSVIYISGNTDFKYKEMISETSFVDFMCKPVDFNRLELLLSEISGSLVE